MIKAVLLKNEIERNLNWPPSKISFQLCLTGGTMEVCLMLSVCEHLCTQASKHPVTLKPELKDFDNAKLVFSGVLFFLIKRLKAAILKNAPTILLNNKGILIRHSQIVCVRTPV